MSNYASLTVPQLKELLKTRSLSVDGKKADLVARLTEADAAQNGNELDEPENELDEPGNELDDEDEQPKAEAAPVEAEKAPEPVAAAEPEKTDVEEPKKETKPERKVLTPEERKQLAVDLLTKKLKRAEKFGDEALAQEARNNLARVEKFGVDPGTALAKEIGAMDRSINSELKTHRVKKSRGKKKTN